MKNTLFILLMIVYYHAFSQKKDSFCISKQQLIGTWQRDRSVVGNGLGQNFVFHDNGTFVLNLGNDGDDVRSVIALKGKYRLTDDEIFFTIVSKTVIEGPLTIGDMGVTMSLFQYGAGAKIREVKEPTPKEFVDPCYIIVLSSNKIKLNNETYYKIGKGSK